MERKNKVTDKKGFVAILYVLMGIGLLLVSSCVTPGSVSDGSDAKTLDMVHEKPRIFQSQDYIICELIGKETPESLARRFLGDPKKEWMITENNPGVAYEKGERIVIPLKDQRRGGLTADGYQKVPILVYHTFAERCKSKLCVSRQVFEEQMAYLKDNGYRVIALSDLIGFLEFRTGLPEKAVVITIDDGYRSVYDIAYPILKKYGFTATLFVYMDFIGIPRSSVTWDELREMKANGFEIGSHTMTHADLTKRMDGEGEQGYLHRVKKELVASKKMIDQKLEQETVSLAFPYGAYNEKVLALSEAAGYKLCLSVIRGGNPFFTHPLTLRRSQMLDQRIEYFVDNLDTFHQMSLRGK
jgi:peptidoglycan/xylan/chitin deacetylase (PgdA/CDA1 family)